MKGRTPTKAEKQLHDRLCQLGCIACRKDGRMNTFVSIHHINGRTRKDAHMTVLPLCGQHHQLDPESVHGNKARFEARYGKQDALLAECMAMLEDSDAADRY